MVFYEELERLAAELPFFTYIPWVADEAGFLTAEKMAAVAPVADREFLLCGPPPMMKALETQLKKAGVFGRNIHFERFSLL